MFKAKSIFLTFPLLVMLIITSVITFAYSSWSDKLKPSISTGIAKDYVSFVEWSCSDIGPDPQVEGYSNTEDKNVGSCSLDVIEIDRCGSNIVLSVVLINVYPGYGVEIKTVLENVGTVPLQLIGYTIKPENLPIDVELKKPKSTYMNPGSRALYILNLVVKQDADENSNYLFKITLWFGPWFKPQFTRFTSYKAHAHLGIRGCNKEEGRVLIENEGKKARVIFDKFTGGWGWIGLVISNTGHSGTTINKNQITVTTNRDMQQIKVFLYGPFQNPGNSGAWNNVDICKMTQNLNNYNNPFPDIEHHNVITLEAYQKAILWIYVKGSSGPLTVNIELQ